MNEPADHPKISRRDLLHAALGTALVPSALVPAHGAGCHG